LQGVRVEIVHLVKQADNLALLFLCDETTLHAGVTSDFPLATMDPET
jgi:hypothetical protein